MDGDLDELLDALQQEYQAELLAAEEARKSAPLRNEPVRRQRDRSGCCAGGCGAGGARLCISSSTSPSAPSSAVAWYLVAAALYNHHLSIARPLDPDGVWFAVVAAPPLAIFLLYHVVLEILSGGRTPGKRLAALRIVARDGNTPSAGALLARNVFRLIDSFPMVYGVGLIATMLTRNQARIGDLAAGTLLVHERVRDRRGAAAERRPARSAARSAAGAEVADRSCCSAGAASIRAEARVQARRAAVAAALSRRRRPTRSPAGERQRRAQPRSGRHGR